MQTKTFETERLILRKAALLDAEDIFYNYASRDKVTEFLSWQSHKTLDDTTSYLTNVVLPDYEKEAYCWFIEHKELRKVIGNISVVNIDIDKKYAELGWVLSDDYWGQGLMPEAAIVVLNYLKELGFVRIEAKHKIENAKSGRVMQKIGMQFEGILRKAGLDNKGNLCDLAVYSYINGED